MTEYCCRLLWTLRRQKNKCECRNCYDHQQQTVISRPFWIFLKQRWQGGSGIKSFTSSHVHADVFEHPPPWLASRRPIWSDMTSVDTITQWREDWSSASVVNHTIVTLLSDSQVSISLVIHGLCWTVSGRVKVHVVEICTNGASPNHLLAIVASDRPWATLLTCVHIRSESTPWSGWWCSHMAGSHSDCSTREMKKNSLLWLVAAPNKRCESDTKRFRGNLGEDGRHRH